MRAGLSIPGAPGITTAAQRKHGAPNHANDNRAHAANDGSNAQLEEIASEAERAALARLVA